MAAKKKSALDPKLIIIAVVVLLLIGIGAYFMMGKKSSEDGQMAGGNAFTSIKDALTKSVSLECEYAQEEGVAYKAYIKNGAVRMDSTSADPEKAGSIIMKDKKMYTWNEKEGFMMTIPDVKDPATGEVESSQSEDFIKDLEEYKDNCKVAVVSDSLFTPPSDVTFTDMSKMMESIPTDGGMNGESGMSEEDLKKMMEQYGGQE